MNIVLNIYQMIGLIVAVAGVFILVGCAIGYYSSELDHEHKQQKVLDSVAVTPNRTLDQKSLAMGYAFAEMTHRHVP